MSFLLLNIISIMSSTVLQCNFHYDFHYMMVCSNIISIILCLNVISFSIINITFNVISIILHYNIITIMLL